MSAEPTSGALTAAAERVTFDSLLWISACLTLTLLVGIAALPIWVTLTVAASAGIRLVQAARGRDAPPRSIRFLIAVLAIGLLFLQFRTFNGLSAGTALLSLIAGLKLLETRTRRDIYGYDLLAWALYKSGRNAEARAPMARSLVMAALGTLAALWAIASLIAN